MALLCSGCDLLSIDCLGGGITWRSARGLAAPTGVEAVAVVPACGCDAHGDLSAFELLGDPA